MTAEDSDKPLFAIPATEALRNLEQNKSALWKSTIGRVHMGRMALQLDRQALIAPGEVVWAMGSCFAYEVELAMIARGFPVRSKPEPWGFEEYSMYRYNTASMRQEFERGFDPTIGLKDEELVFRDDNGRYRDAHLNPDVDCDSMDVIRSRRALAREILLSVREARLVVLTLGLNEMWYDPHSGRYLNAWSNAGLLAKQPHLQFQGLSVGQNVRNLDAIHDYITRNCRSDVNIVVTVSPVGLYATFTEDDIVVANTRSKIILRAAAEEFTRRHANVHYFPSWEIAMFSEYGTVYEADGRHVQRAMAEHIVGIFCDRHVG